MTYLFLVIGVSVVNALANKKISYSELAICKSYDCMGLLLDIERIWLIKA